MRVAENTSERLVVRAAPWYFAYFFIAMILFVVWLGLEMIAFQMMTEALGMMALTIGFLTVAMYRFCQFKEVILDRRAGTVELLRRTLLGNDHAYYKLDQLVGARVDDPDILTERRGGIGPVFLVFDCAVTGGINERQVNAISFGHDNIRAANAINTWLANHVDSHERQA